MATSSSAFPKAELDSPATAAEGSRRGADQAYLPAPKRARKERVCTAKERISRMAPCVAGKRSSIYRGVTRYALLLVHNQGEECLFWKFIGDIIRSLVLSICI